MFPSCGRLPVHSKRVQTNTNWVSTSLTACRGLCLVPVVCCVFVSPSVVVRIIITILRMLILCGLHIYCLCATTIVMTIISEC